MRRVLWVKAPHLHGGVHIQVHVQQELMMYSTAGVYANEPLGSVLVYTVTTISIFM